MAKHKINPADDVEVDAGASSLEDAQISGYTDAEGRAISKARPDPAESTVGGYTNITSGRSSVVRHKPHHGQS